jgi:hypothetical protein
VIVVRVELHSAITGQVSEIAKMHICNIGGTATKGDYHCETLRGRSKADLDRRTVQRSGSVRNYPRLAIHVWHLVARSLVAMGYAGKDLQVQETDMGSEKAA